MPGPVGVRDVERAARLAATGRLVWTLDGGSNWVLTIASAARAPRFISVNLDGSVSIWDADTLRLVGRHRIATTFFNFRLDNKNQFGVFDISQNAEGRFAPLMAMAVSPDGATSRKLTARQFLAFNFSRDGAQLYGIYRNTNAAGVGAAAAEWQIYSTDVKTGAEKLLSAIDLPASVDGVQSFSLHPDGKRFLTSVGTFPYDIWMLEGWNQPQKTWLDRLLRR